MNDASTVWEPCFFRFDRLKSLEFVLGRVI